MLRDVGRNLVRGLKSFLGFGPKGVAETQRLEAEKAASEKAALLQSLKKATDQRERGVKIPKAPRRSNRGYRTGVAMPDGSYKTPFAIYLLRKGGMRLDAIRAVLGKQAHEYALTPCRGK